MNIEAWHEGESVARMTVCALFAMSPLLSPKGCRKPGQTRRQRATTMRQVGRQRRSHRASP
jgi:hypothetical protein